MPTYHRSRNTIIFFMIIIFLNGVVTLHLRGIQRERNFKELKRSITIEYGTFDNDIDKTIEQYSNRSAKEDTALLVVLNLVTLGAFIIFDRLGMFEKTGDNYRKNIKKIKNLILTIPP